MSSKDLATFQPSPGFLLIDVIEPSGQFKTQDRKPDDSTSRKGRILAIGETYTNDFGTTFSPPEGYGLGTEVLFRWSYNNDELEVDFKKYPVIPFNALRGKL